MTLDFFNIISISSTVIVVITTIAGIIGWIMGICPAIYRLGNGLSKRKIAIFAKGDNTMSLKNLLIDSRLFRQKNIFEITKRRISEKQKKPHCISCNGTIGVMTYLKS